MNFLEFMGKKPKDQYLKYGRKYFSRKSSSSYQSTLYKKNKIQYSHNTAKTHKFANIDDIEEHLSKFRPIIDQTGTTYNAAKVIGNYLKPLAQSEYVIRDTQTFPDLIKSLPPLSHDEEYVSYDVDSLFTNIPLEEMINLILDQIYVHKKLKPIASKLVFKRLLWKITTDCTFQFNGKFYKQIDGCAMGGPLSVILADICMIKMDNDIVRPIVLQTVC
ncbi:MAG: hypothetical protein AAFY76_20450 [Cyanobacteria bacterium J06649_11]